MSLHLVLVNIFLGVSLGIIAIAWIVFDLFFRVRTRVSNRFDETFQQHVEDMQKHSPIIKKMVQIDRPRSFLKWRDFEDQLQTWLDQAAIGMEAMQFLLLSIFTSIIVGIALWWFIDYTLITTCGVVGSLLIAIGFVYSRRNARSEQMTTQLSDAFSAMSRSLRAGTSVPSVVQAIATDFPEPLSTEFRYFFEQQHLGVPQEEALRDMARRVNVMELRIFTIAMIVHGKAGGNLAELLQKLSGLVRKRVKMKRRIKSLTGEGRMQAAILTAMPVLVILIMLLIAPNYIGLILERHDILAACAVSQLIGSTCIYRIVNFSY